MWVEMQRVEVGNACIHMDTRQQGKEDGLQCIEGDYQPANGLVMVSNWWRGCEEIRYTHLND